MSDTWVNLIEENRDWFLQPTEEDFWIWLDKTYFYDKPGIVADIKRSKTVVLAEVVRQEFWPQYLEALRYEANLKKEAFNGRS